MYLKFIVAFLIINISCSSHSNYCTITLDSSLIADNITHFQYGTDDRDTIEVKINSSNKYKLYFKNLSSSDGIIKFKIYKRNTLYCTVNLYYSNGIMLSKEFQMKSLGNGNCIIQEIS